MLRFNLLDVQVDIREQSTRSRGESRFRSCSAPETACAANEGLAPITTDAAQTIGEKTGSPRDLAVCFTMAGHTRAGNLPAASAAPDSHRRKPFRTRNHRVPDGITQLIPGALGGKTGLLTQPVQSGYGTGH